MGSADRRRRDRALFDKIDEVLYGHERQRSPEQVGSMSVSDGPLRTRATYEQWTYDPRAAFEDEMVRHHATMAVPSSIAEDTPGTYLSPLAEDLEDSIEVPEALAARHEPIIRVPAEFVVNQWDPDTGCYPPRPITELPVCWVGPTAPSVDEQPWQGDLWAEVGPGDFYIIQPIRRRS